MDGDFKDNLEEFLKENPKYTQKSDNNSDNNITDGVSVKIVIIVKKMMELLQY